MPSVPPLPASHPVQVDRRRRRRGHLSRLLTAPIPETDLWAKGRRILALLWRRGWPVLPVAAVATAAYFVWASRLPVLEPRHRAEALCFALARARFAPPMEVEPSAAVVRGRFSEQTPAALAVREAMRFTDDMVMRQDTRHVGDYQVSVTWLRLPSMRGHWLVVAWMEGADLGVCSFRFAGDEMGGLTAEETLWGNRLLARILTPENFRAGQLPSLRLRGELPRSYGPPS